MASASLPSTPPHQIQFPTPPSIRPSVIINNNDNYKVESSSGSVIARCTNYHTNYQLLHDHNYAALPPTSTAAYFGIKAIRQKNSQCGASGGSANNTPACCSTYSSTNCCYGILTTTLTSASPTSTKFQLNLQLNVLKCENERLNEKCSRQQSQLENLREEISGKTRQLSEQLEKLEEKEERLVEEIIEKTELQGKFNRFRESVTELSCGVILLIGELKKDFNCGGGGPLPVRRNGMVNGKVEGDENESEDNYKWKLGNELGKISELLEDKLRAWVLVDHVIEEEDVRMMKESLKRNRKAKVNEEDGEEKEVQVVVQEVEVVEEEKENLSLVSGGDGEEEDDEEEEQEKVLEEETFGGSGEAVEEDESEKEEDLKVSEISSQRSHEEGPPLSKKVRRRRRNEPVKYQCSNCPSLSMRFEEMCDLKVHLKEVHKNEQWRDAKGCKKCGMVFVGMGQFQKHRSSEHGKPKATMKKKVKRVVQEEAVQGSSRMKIEKASNSKIPEVSAPPPAPAQLSTAPVRAVPLKCKPVKILVSDIMNTRTRSEEKEKNETKKTKRLSRRRSSCSSRSSRSSSLSPPPPVLTNMTKSVRRHGSNNSLASSTFSEISRDSSPPVLDLEGELVSEQEIVFKVKEEPQPQQQPEPPVPVEASPPPPPVAALVSPSPPPPPEKQEVKQEKNMGHFADIARRHLGVFCVCGREFPAQYRLDMHIRLKREPIHRHRFAIKAIREKTAIKAIREKTAIKAIRKKKVRKEKQFEAGASENSSSRMTRRSSIISATTSLLLVSKAVAKAIPSTSASAVASTSASISKKVTTVVAAAPAPVPVKLAVKRVKGSRIIHGLHSTKPLHCKCGHKAPLLAFLKRHINFYKPDRKFSCQICHRVYLSVRYLSHHYKSFHNVMHTNELITARGHVGKLMNCYVKIDKLDLDLVLNGHGPTQKNKSSIKTEDDLSPTRQLPWRPIFKKKLKKLRFTKRKERFICPWCQRHFPFYRKLARHLALNMHTGCGGGGGSDMGAGSKGKAGGVGGGALKKMLYGCKPCEKIFYNQVEFLRHKAVFHRCSNSLTKFLTVQKEINAAIAAAAAAEASNDLISSEGIKTRRARMSSKSSSYSLSSSTKAIASTSAAARSGQVRPTKSARKRSFVSKSKPTEPEQERRSSSSSPSRNSKCLCNPSDSSSPCNAGGGNKKRGKKNFQCSKCQRVFTCPAYLRMHMGEKHNINCVIPKPCQRCGKVFSTASQLKKHAEVAHNKLRKPEKRRDRQETPPPRKVPPSRPTPSSPVGPHKQMGGGGSRFKCVCGSLFSMKKLLFKHIQERNQDRGKLFKCTLCPKQYPGGVHLKVHMLRAHNVRSVTSKSKSKTSSEIWCQTCGMIFDTKRKRIWHESRAHKLKKKGK